MRAFVYKNIFDSLLDAEVVSLLGAIREYKGKQEFYNQVKPEILRTLLDVAKIQSAKASNSIEGIFTTDARLKELMDEKTEPHSRDEQEIAGYRDVLNTIHQSFADIPLRSEIILQLHRDLYAYNAIPGGQFKNSDNVIEECDVDGKKHVRFQPLSAFETPQAIKDLCLAFNQARQAAVYDELLLIGLFVLDFLCIHPFNDGNGRMSRLLTTLLLYQADFTVGKYISLEMLIEKNKAGYYDALRESSVDWIKGTNDAKPFIKYLLSVILKAYRELDARVNKIVGGKMTAEARIAAYFAQSLAPKSKQDILEFMPDISQSSVERVLSSLLKQGKIKKTGQGRLTKYVRNYSDK